MYSYIAPLLTQSAGWSTDAVPWLMAFAGVGMTVGAVYGGKLTDKLGPIKTVILLMLVMTLVLLLDGAFAHVKLAMIPLVFLSGGVAMAMASPIQLLLIAYSKESELLGSSIGQGSFNMANSLGAYLGGVPLAMGYGYAATEFVGASLALTGAAIGGALLLRERPKI